MKQLYKQASHELVPLPRARGCALLCCARLRLSHNKLASLPGSFGLLNYLRDLRLDNNFLHPESFPHSFSAMEVEYLDLRNNLCRTLPMQIAHLKYVTTLDLRYAPTLLLALHAPCTRTRDRDARLPLCVVVQCCEVTTGMENPLLLAVSYNVWGCS